MKKVLIISIIVFTSLWSLKSAFCQTTERERWVENEKIRELQKTEERILREEKQFYIDSGGWVSLDFIFNSNDDNKQRTSDVPYRTQDIDLRHWFRGTVLGLIKDRPENDFYFYLRTKSRWLYKDPADASIAVYDSDFEGLILDMGYVNFDFRPMFNLRAGRQYMRLGRGIVYNNVHDGVEVNGSYSAFEGKIFASKTPEHEDNIDYSVPGWDKGSDRNFLGIEGTLLTIPNHRPYAFFLLEGDNSQEEPEDTTYEYDYDASYFGIGSNGQLIKDMRYWAEFILESGKSYRYDNTSSTSDIDAMAADLGVSYYLNVDSHPIFTMEYAYGSGDSDRQNVTNTLNGNTNDKDNNFLYFGYYPSGFALAPRLSNIKVFGLGASFKPLELIKGLNEETGKNFQLGTKTYIYRKAKANGGISDLDATDANTTIGYEIDAYANWRISSDLIWSLQYGHFNTSKAYPTTANDNENYLFTNVVFSF